MKYRFLIQGGVLFLMTKFKPLLQPYFKHKCEAYNGKKKCGEFFYKTNRNWSINISLVYLVA